MNYTLDDLQSSSIEVMNGIGTLYLIFLCKSNGSYLTDSHNNLSKILIYTFFNIKQKVFNRGLYIVLFYNIPLKNCFDTFQKDISIVL